MKSAHRIRELHAIAIAIAVSFIAQSTLAQIVQFKLRPRGDGSDWGYGGAVDIEGDIAVIGAPEEGKVYVYERRVSAWHLRQSVEAGGLRSFGWDLDLNGDTLVVGAAAHNKAYVFTRVDGDFTYAATLAPSDGDENDQFGFAVAVDDYTVVVGAPTHLMPIADGAAYVFVRSGRTWTEQQKLRGPLRKEAQFGASVALSGNIVICGAPQDFESDKTMNLGSAHVFAREDDHWEPQSILRPSDGVPNGLFGYSMALVGKALLIGSPLAGKAYLFKHHDGDWTETQIIAPPEGGPEAAFGTAVAMSDSAATIGAPKAGADAGGAIYAYRRADGALTDMLQFEDKDGAPNDGFGTAVAESDYWFVVGAPGDGPVEETDAGSAVILACRILRINSAPKSRHPWPCLPGGHTPGGR